MRRSSIGSFEFFLAIEVSERNRRGEDRRCVVNNCAKRPEKVEIQDVEVANIVAVVIPYVRAFAPACAPAFSHASPVRLRGAWCRRGLWRGLHGGQGIRRSRPSPREANNPSEHGRWLG